MPTHHNLEAYLDAYIDAAGIRDAAKTPLFRGARGRSGGLGSLFEVARAFFRMGKHKVRQYHHSVPGTYRFYAYSEGDRGRAAVCLGAIRFDEDFSAEELQTSVIEETGNTIRLWVMCSITWVGIVGLDAIYYWPSSSSMEEQWTSSIRPHLQWALGVPFAAMTVGLTFFTLLRWVWAGFKG